MFPEAEKSGNYEKEKVEKIDNQEKVTQCNHEDEKVRPGVALKPNSLNFEQRHCG